MQKLLKINRYIFLAIMLGACHKDNPQVIVAKPQNTSSSSECHEYVYTGLFGSGAFVTTGDQYIEPCFNPNNQDEFVYVKQTSGTMQLVKHTISTGQEQVLHEGMFFSPSQWGKQGWILFSVGTHPPLVIWKIYEDGSGLAQVTPSNLNCHHPCFNEAGDKFIHGGEAIKFPYLCIYNLNGEIVDSLKYDYDTLTTGIQCSYNLNFKTGYCSYWDLATSPNDMGIGKLNNNTSIERLSKVSSPPNGGAFITTMCQNTEAVYYTQYQLGLYRLDKTSHQTSLVMENCQSNYINSLSMSPDGQFLLYERINGHQTSPGSWDIDLQSEIFLYNIATGQQTKLLGEE